MIATGIIEKNRASWIAIQLFVDHLSDEAWRDWKRLVVQVIRSGMNAGWDRYFRAGQSLADIIFSTAEQHGLERTSLPPPRVTLHQRHHEYFVGYSHYLLFSQEPERRDVVTAENVFPVLRSYLITLWQETRPTEPSPL